MYRSRRVEDVFEIWLLSRRPWCENLRVYPYIDQLFDLEIIAFHTAVEWYHTALHPRDVPKRHGLR